MALFAIAVATLPRVHAAFVGTTQNSANSLSAAATFPDYPTTVVGDSPLFYYRLDDPAGSITATDFSGNGLTGVYGSGKYSQGWTGLWPMDEGAGTTAKDMSGVAVTHDLTRNGAAWTASGRSRSALSFNGTSDTAATASSVVATNATFLVSAWVYLTDTTVSRTALSQDGSAVSGFELGYDQPTNRWVFAMPRSNSAAAVVDKVTSSAAPSTSTWTQLTATYDSSTNAMNLYVNGVQQTGITFAGTAWNATGVLQVGAGKVTSQTHFWKGSIDAVRTHTGPSNVGVTARELTIGATGAAGTSWQFDENSATTAADSSGHLNTGTLGSAASWGTAKSGASSVDLPGNTSGNGYVAGGASGVTTSTSFSVAAWVYLDHTTLAAMSRVAVSQSGNIKSGFMLRYNYYSTQWQFAVTKGAADDYAPSYDLSTSAGLAVLNTWTHLVGVYDATAQTVTLYVNGAAQTPAAHTSLFTATGALQAGRVKEFGTWQAGAAGSEAWGPWAGRLDDIRAYRRALDQPEITAIYTGSGGYTTLGVPGALQGAQQGQSSSTAMALSSDSRVSYNPAPYTNPTTYSLECWFRTGGAAGAVTLISFGNKVTGNSTAFDRRLFLDASGHVAVGTNSGVSNIAQSTATYINSAWHHAVATVSPGTGLNLYVDGALVGSAAYTAPSNYTGYWRWGGDTWSPGVWTADYYHLGELDEVAVYGSVLTAQQVARNYYANH